MAERSTRVLPQDRETPIQTGRSRYLVYRYAYGRSAGSRQHGDPGQDYLVFRDDDACLAFVLCDGVSQSFFGDLAARHLGNALLDVLWREISSLEDYDEILSVVVDRLKGFTQLASKEVHQLVLPSDLPPMQVDVLEDSREAGSESTFIAGFLDPSQDRLLLIWMGDSRFQLWGPRGEPSVDFEATFKTHERWSTRRGPLGEAHIFSNSLTKNSRLAIYSDGLVLLKPLLNHLVPNREIERTMAQAEQAPTSDDMSFLEIVASQDASYLESVMGIWTGEVTEEVVDPPGCIYVRVADGQLRVWWDPVPGASWYEVKVSGQPRPLVARKPQLTIPRSGFANSIPYVRVRTVVQNTRGEWSEAVAMFSGPTADRRFWLLTTGALLVVLVLSIIAGYLIRPVVDSPKSGPPTPSVSPTTAFETPVIGGGVSRTTAIGSPSIRRSATKEASATSVLGPGTTPTPKSPLATVTVAVSPTAQFYIWHPDSIYPNNTAA